MPDIGNMYDGRYAPSPTGELHLGNLRTAVIAWLFARGQAARFVLRIEDLDRGRVVPGMAQQHLQDLEELGLSWDEPPMVQSERLPAYQEAVDRLTALDLTYPCFCSRTDIRSAASAPHGEFGEVTYPGTCRTLDPAHVVDRIARGEKFCIRLAADGAAVTFTDRMLGSIESTVDDMVLVRRDGVFAYNLAVVVDDAAQRVGEVVRGDDLALGTPRQLWLARSLGVAEPRSFAHVPLVLSADGRRLAKRHRDATLADWIASGRSAADLLAWIARSLHLASARERPNLMTLLNRFDPTAIPREPIVVG